MKIKILIGPSTFGMVDSLPVKKLLSADFEIINNPFGRKLSKKELTQALTGVKGLIAGLEILDKEVLKNSELEVISRCGSGMDNIDLEAASALNIKVFSTPDAPTIAVSELTIGAMLSLLRAIPEMNKSFHEGKWTKRIGCQLSGKKIAIIGFGRIGRRVAKLLTAFDAHILAVDPILSGKIDGITMINLEEALTNADIVTLHSSGKVLLIGAREFGLIKKGVYILNAARGGLIDEGALIKAIEEGKVAGAWLDTFIDEPYNGPLTKYEQVILTPHAGSYTYECRSQMEMEAADNLITGFYDLK